MNVFREATGKDSTVRPVDDRAYLDLGEVSGASVAMVLTEMGSGGVGGSQASVSRAIDALSPSAVIMVGIAFGINEAKQAIGQILVSKQLMLYELQRVETGEDPRDEIVPTGDRPHASARLIEAFRMGGLTWPEPHARISYGLVLSGEKLVDNINFRDQLMALERKAIGGEMEGAGIYVACHNAKVDWILVKAICDWADGKKGTRKAARQRLAASNAAAFVLHALQHGYFKSNAELASRPGVLSSSTTAAEHWQPVHNSLPSQPYFFGREKELAAIAEAISPEARTWGALIDGPGGIGKTALAICAGHRAPDAQFERKLFLSAKVRELRPTGEEKLEDFVLPNYMALLTELARELGEDAIAQLEPGVRANALRRALSGVRALLVIDNVETFPEDERVRLYQFLSFLPTACKAIVTSRRRTDVDARVVRLDRLERKDALDLMAELAKTNRHLKQATEEERGSLYEITTGNPLLIKWTVGQLGRGGSQCRTIAEANAFLKAAPTGNDPLEYIFGDLLDTFTENESAVLAALAHFTHPAKVEWIADVAEIAEAATRTALEDLTDRALLLSDEGSRAFLLPPLAATFLRRKRPEAISRTGDRLTDRAYAIALENGWTHHERFPVLEAEWPTLVAALSLFQHGDNDRLQSVCAALDDFLGASGRWDERLTIYQIAFDRAVEIGDSYTAGWRAFSVAWTYMQRDQISAGIAWSARCADQWAASPQSTGRERAFGILLRGIGHEEQKEYRAALLAHRQSLRLLRAIEPESLDVAFVLASLADVERDQDNYSAAGRNYRESLRIARAMNDRGGIALNTGKLAQLAIDQGAWVDGGRLAQEALDLAESVGLQELVAYNCRRLAEALVGQGKSQEALPFALRSVEISRRLRIPSELEKAQAVVKQSSG
jgi:nucleoside phosphorylase/tetratricopeptide (TPR) repeat protein